MKVAKFCLTLWPHGLYSPWNSSGQNTGIGSILPPPEDLTNPGIEPRPPALQEDSLPAEPPGKPKNTGRGSLFLLQQIFLIHKLNCGLLHCRWILYQHELPGNRHETRLSQAKKYNNHSTQAWHKVEWQQMFWTNNLSYLFASRNYTFW